MSDSEYSDISDYDSDYESDDVFDDEIKDPTWTPANSEDEVREANKIWYHLNHILLRVRG